MRIQRLGPGDRDLAQRMFTVLAEVFETEHAALRGGYVDALLNRNDFWALAAVVDDAVVGGLTAFTLPLTRIEASEIFIYDIAVRQEHQRRGIGRALVTALRQHAADAGISDAFVPAENEDAHALDFYRALGGTPSAVTILTFS